MSAPQGFLLLAIDDCTISGPHDLHESGTLYLECVTLVVPSSNKHDDRDVWLILRLNHFEMPISPLNAITHSRLKNTYTFSDSHDAANGNISLRLPQASDTTIAQDLETFEVLLEQYGMLHTDIPGPHDEKSPAFESGPGKLVLVDEEDGHIVGSLGEEFRIREAKSVMEQGKEKDPVIVDIPEGDEQEIVVHSISAQENDSILKAAGMLSRGIIMATNALTSTMSSAADLYISHSTPREKPVHFSVRSNKNIKRIHNVSGQAVKVTAYTTGLIHRAIDRVVAPLAGTPAHPPPLPSRTGAPPLPPRPGEKTGTTSYSSSQVTTAEQKPRLLNRILISTDLLLSTLEQSATTLVDKGTNSLSRGLTHKYGKEVGDATTALGQTVRNVGVVYIDARGVGRRAIIRRAGKRIIKGRIGHNEVVFGEPGPGGVASLSPVPSPVASPAPSLISNNVKPPPYDKKV